MKTIRILCLLTSAFCLSAFAQGTAFTYQGRLNDGGNPANGIYDLSFSLHQLENGGNAFNPIRTNLAVAVAGGSFTVTLDFGPGQFTGQPRWIEIAVRTNGGGAFTTLSPRQALLPTPYAILAADISDGAAIVDAKLATLTTPGKVANSATTASSANTANAIVTRDAAGNFAAGTISAGTLSATGNVGAGGDLLGSRLNVGVGHQLTGSGATIAGGLSNTNLGQRSTIAGGHQNIIQTNTADDFIGAGIGNAIQGSTWRSTIGGGGVNTISTNSSDATIGGGFWNTIQTNADYSSIGGGYKNTTAGEYGTVPGGRENVAGTDGFAAGRRAKANHSGAFVWADAAAADFASTSNNQFNVRATGGVRIETAGAGMTLDSQPVLAGTVTSSVIADGAVTTGKIANNAVTDAQLASGSVTSARILDGTIVNADIAAGAAITDDKLATISSAGKVANSATTATSANTANALVARDASGNFSAGNISAATLSASGSISAAALSASDTISAETLSVSGNISAGVALRGALLNVGSNHQLSGTYPTIAGGQNNTNLASWSSVGGGNQNVVQGNATFATIAGGRLGNVGSAASYAFVGGGYQNIIQGNSTYSTVVGGRANSIETNTSYSFVGGGYQNLASGDYSVIGGGQDNVASGSRSVVPGGYLNEATGSYSLAAGRQAKAAHQGAFVWGDSTTADFSSTANNQFLIRASGGVGIGTASPAGDLHVRGNSADASLVVGAGAANGNADLFLAEDAATTMGMILRYEGNANQFQVVTRSGGVDTAPKVVINRDNGRVGIGTSSPVSALHVNGTATVSVLSITGGADLAEPIPATGDPIPKGALVVIDDENPGCVKMSQLAYDTRVAGIISGANGVNPGITLQQDAVLNSGPLVALSGRVYALADAAHGPIKPGDLLTTSPTPGHAMKATDTQKTPGAVLGKAMTGLAEGQGLVLVLVSLQ